MSNYRHYCPKLAEFTISNKYFSIIFDIIGVIEICIYSSGNWVGIGVTLLILHDSGKLPEVKRAQNILVNLGEIKSAVFFKSKENILSGSEVSALKEAKYFLTPKIYKKNLFSRP